MLEPLHLRVSTPEGAVVEAEGVTWMRVRLADGGSIGIRPGHAPLLAETSAGPLRYGDGTEEHSVDLEGGILQVHAQGVDIYASTLVTSQAHRQERDDAQDAAWGLAGELFVDADQDGPKDGADGGGLEVGSPAPPLRFERLARSLLQTLQADHAADARSEQSNAEVR